MRPSIAVGLAVILVILGGMPPAIAQSTQESPAATAGADQSIAGYLMGPVSEGRSPGLFAAIIDGDGIRSIAVAGVRKQGSSEEMTVDDLVHIGSNTKVMTSVMLAQLVAEGVFPNGWKTSVGDVFPELVGKIHPGYESVRLDSLLRMRGGIAPNAADWWASRDKEIKDRRYRILRKNLKRPPKGASGDFLYSNLSYMVAGAMAERLTGKAWEDLMKQRVFAPLGMTTAGFGAPGRWMRTDQPWGHRRGDNGAWKAQQIDNAAALGPAGTVHLSLADYAKFVRLWFRGTAPAILDRNRLDYLATPHSGRYAAGWGVRERSWGRGTVLTHNGSNTYWRITIWVAPNLDRAYLAGANSDEKGTHRMLDAIIGKLIRH